MTDLSGITNAFVEAAKRSCPLENMVYTAAYPHTVKNTVLKTVVVAFSVYDAEVSPEGIGENIYSGGIKISAAIYIPKYLTGNGTEAAMNIAKALCSGLCSEFNITGLKVTAPQPDADTECVVTRVIFTVDDELE